MNFGDLGFQVMDKQFFVIRFVYFYTLNKDTFSGFDYSTKSSINVT